MQYNPVEIESKWNEYWKKNNIYTVHNTSDKPKCYILDMFPYPSGAGLHVGHPLGYIASDIYARYKKLCGYNVLHPMGFDAFGLPAEQYAIETGKHPAETTAINIERYKSQLDKIGFCYDWNREVRTSDPNYYRWTQWIFLQLYNSWYDPILQKATTIDTLLQKINDKNSTYYYPYKNETELHAHLMKYRLAYKAETYVNWCEALGTVLANDEVINGVSERGGHPVIKKRMSQWMLRITSYAERLLSGLEKVDFPESLKDMQRNWIGKSTGATIHFSIENSEENIEVFTTRPDTIFGVSFLVLAPEHTLVNSIVNEAQYNAIQDYMHYVNTRSERERMAETKKITGCFTGSYAIHPINGNKIPIWIAEYVLAGYGTGAIMAVPAGDERDFAFAKHFNITIPEIFENHDITLQALTDKNAKLKNSDFLNGLNALDAIQKSIDFLVKNNKGNATTQYKIRDAGFSRQRYWGEPFPIVYDENNIDYALQYNELPLTLPHLAQYNVGAHGKGPLHNASEWINEYKDINNPNKKYVRETDTMPGYAGSSWYYLRYMDPHNKETFCDIKASDYWGQVDVYIGGAEHAVGHLLYSRMWCKVLYDLGYISFDEPYKKLINQGMIGGSSRFVYRVKGTSHFVSFGLKDKYETDVLHVDVNMTDGKILDIEKFKKWRKDFENATFELENNQYICGEAFEKMSKSKYNVVNPDDIIEKYGADTFRLYEMFLGPIEMSKPWDTKGIEGVHRFFKKFWKLFYNEEGKYIVETTKATDTELKILHKHIKKIKIDTENFAFNTAVSQFMIVCNELHTLQCHKQEILGPLIVTLAAYAPHIAEELWHTMGNNNSVLNEIFPTYDESLLVENTFRYPIAINGKTRTEITFALNMNNTQMQEEVLRNETVLKWMEGKPLKKIIIVNGRMINIVV